MEAKDFDYILLCKDKNEVVRQVIIDKNQILLMFEHQTTVLNKEIRVIEEPILGISWKKNKPKKKEK